MNTLVDRISRGLLLLLGQPLTACWRAADMQIFEFGPQRPAVNRLGEPITRGHLLLHVQCRWRFVDEHRILFGYDDLYFPADETLDRIEEFDWDEQDSVLDVTQHAWFEKHRHAPPTVIEAIGRPYGGFRIAMEGGFALEGFPCDSRRGEYSEHWRLHNRDDRAHFVVTGYGVEGEDEPRA